MKTKNRSILLLLAVCLAVFPAAGQESPETAHQVIRLQHVGPTQVAKLLHHSTRASLIPSDELSLISIYGPVEDVAHIEAAIREIDVPRAVSEIGQRSTRNVEITTYFLGVDDQAQAESFEGPLGAVVEQLKRTFPYLGYRLLDTLVCRGRVGGSADVTGVVAGDENPWRPARYQFRAEIDGVSGEGDAQTISLNGMSAGMRVPVQRKKDEFGSLNLGVHTDIDIPAGKLVVVGKAGTKEAVDGMFIVISARVVD